MKRFIKMNLFMVLGALSTFLFSAPAMALCNSANPPCVCVNGHISCPSTGNGIDFGALVIGGLLVEPAEPVATPASANNSCPTWNASGSDPGSAGLTAMQRCMRYFKTPTDNVSALPHNYYDTTTNSQAGAVVESGGFVHPEPAEVSQDEFGDQAIGSPSGNPASSQGLISANGSPNAQLQTSSGGTIAINGAIPNLGTKYRPTGTRYQGVPSIHDLFINAIVNSSSTASAGLTMAP